jgi:hypothetical protein
MSTLLKGVVKKWKRSPEYTDVQASYWEPNQPQVETCPQGCNLQIWEQTFGKWSRISGYDAYRQTRFCRKHGFARIYIITGPTGLAHNWNPQKE